MGLGKVTEVLGPAALGTSSVGPVLASTHPGYGVGVWDRPLSPWQVLGRQWHQDAGGKRWAMRWEQGWWRVVEERWMDGKKGMMDGEVGVKAWVG